MLPMAMAGATVETKARSGESSGQAMPIVPRGSRTAKVKLRSGVAWTVPAYLSAQAALVKSLSIARSTSALASDALAPHREIESMGS